MAPFYSQEATQSHVKMTLSAMPSSRRRSNAPKALSRALATLFSIQVELERRAKAAAKVLEAVRDKALHGACGWEREVDLWSALLRDCPCLETLLRIEDKTSPAENEGAPQTAPYGAAEPSAEQPAPSAARIRTRSCASERRKPAAFGAVAAARSKLLQLEAAVVELCTDARALLDHIEGDRLHLECGYESFEDLLERAIGPNPAFSTLLHRAAPSKKNASGAASTGVVYGAGQPQTGTPAESPAESKEPSSAVLELAEQLSTGRAWVDAQNGAEDLARSQAASLFLAPPRVPADLRAQPTIPAPPSNQLSAEMPSCDVDMSEVDRSQTRLRSERPLATPDSQVQKVATRIDTPTQADGLIALVAERERNSSAPPLADPLLESQQMSTRQKWVRAGVAAAVAALAGASLAFRP